MKKIEIQGSMDHPAILLDKKNGIFKITGKSVPKDADMFYKPIIDWFSEYFTTPNPKTEVNINMEYINTASSKTFLSLFLLFEKAKLEGKNIIIKWFYQKSDEDIYDIGEEYSDIVNVPFEFIAVEDEE